MDKNQVEIFKNIDKATEHFHALIDALNVVSKRLIAPWLESLRTDIEIRQSSREIKTQSRLMTVKETADYLQVQEGTLRVWANQGEIPTRRIKSEIRFDRREIDEWSRLNIHTWQK
ncbi:MAG: helix-turn-helix domain-containing protein [Acidobacteria bacterium]|nr:helix-turn-helix domain-containing protein [Acidobacteriota bacterium]